MMYINTNILLHKDHKIGKICTLGIFLFPLSLQICSALLHDLLNLFFADHVGIVLNHQL